jgi:hypothetical protein
MKTIGEWQGEVHARNAEKGFYDYERDLRLVTTQLLPVIERLTSDCDEEIAALERILTDYTAAMRERKLLLVIGELCEAHEELRAGHKPSDVYTQRAEGNWLYQDPSTIGANEKPEGYLIEMADAQIRLLDLVESDGLDMEKAMEVKDAYNQTRPYKHGKRF